MNKVDDLEGYSLHHYVKDENERADKRAATIAKIMEDKMNSKGLLESDGMYLLLEYWKYIENNEKEKTYELLKMIVEEKNLIPGGI